ncbi:hypothetical protein TARUN_3687 [Trichoderma arundinaceum]|uniref:DUF2293 domain-containing protein n=1 Tax=Trichoderma arundinaceum TaxID=490622 RepID=A0A395NR42_TRIAR|nr:hypothetical protein TARUN_3687 [Trichoderma arundinaceum]
MSREPTVSQETPMPKGYGFLRKGNPFMTALCRRKTHDAKKTLYVVMKHGKQEGLRAPKWILHQVFSEEKATRERRRGAVQKRDAATEDAFEKAIRKLFSKIPKQDLATILKRTLRKRSGRVGRTGKLDLEKKAYLAVQAHIRHCHTDYDKLTKATQDRDAARRAIREKVSKLLVEWGGEPAAVKPGGFVQKEDKRRPQENLPNRAAKTRRMPSTAATRTRIYKPMPRSKQNLTQRRHSKGCREAPPQSQPIVIDLTQDEDGPEQSESTGQVSSEDEYRDSEQEEDDGSYELSDAVDSDGDYEIDSDRLSD